MTDNQPDDSQDVASADRADLATTAITSAYKVLGELTDHDGVGVLGHNTATSGTAYGVEGVTDSAQDGAAGVRGVGTASSGGVYGALGLTDSTSGVGVVGAASATTPLPNFQGFPTGVWGATDKSGADADVGFGTAVFGGATASSGEAYGVFGATDSPDGYGLYTPDDAKIEGVVDTGETDFVVEAGTTATSAATNVVHGHVDNQATSGVVGGVIGGGGRSGSQTVGGSSRANSNEVSANYGTIAGGLNNRASGIEAVVGGGEQNTASAENATVAGGDDNTASALISTVAGGGFNTAESFGATIGGGGWNLARGEWTTIAGGGPTDSENRPTTSNVVFDNHGTIGGGGNNQAGSDDGDPTTAEYATVGGGFGNVASAFGATIPGGADNTADAPYSFAAGRAAATSGFEGAFVWGDATSTAVTSIASNAVVMQAGGSRSIGPAARVFSQSDGSAGVVLTAGSGSWSSLSSAAAKTDIEPVEGHEVLDTLDGVEISTWCYETQDEDARHMGPMAGEFNPAFGLGTDDERITNVDADGVALAAIKGLSARLEDAREELDEKGDRIDALEAETDDLRAENERLRERLAALEAQVASTGLASADD